jgi:radical SAM protein with 4Fe4S-binding SPASM domain
MVCAYCPGAGASETRKEMDWALFTKIIDECAEHDVRRFSPHLICEPLLARSLEDMIDYAKKKIPRLKVSFSTNGTLLTRERVARFAELGVEEITVNFTMIDEETYTRVHGNFYKVVRRNVLAAIEELKKRGFPTTLSLDARRLSFISMKQLYDFYHAWEQEGVRVRVGPIWNRAGNAEDFDQVRGGRLKHRRPMPCSRPKDQIAILNDGKVVLCSLDQKSEVVLGDARTQSLAEIWNGERLEAIRRKHAEDALGELDLCRSCIRTDNYYATDARIEKFVMSRRRPSNPIGKALFNAYLGAVDLL